jgi:undecaprenyl-diphosphatase
MTISMALLLALLQGLTEFLPISSSGHLVIAETMLGLRAEGSERGIMFEICIHVGTLAAVLCVYRQRVGLLVRSMTVFVASRFRVTADTAEDVRYIWYVVLASVPAAAAGLLVRNSISAVFEAPRVTALLLVVTGIVVMISRVRTPEKPFTWRTALLIGVAQAVAILPGCSRSGWTITAGLLAGLGFRRAAEFSFIISIPAVLGALLLESLASPLAASRSDAASLLIGMVAAFLVGCVALRFLLNVLRAGMFHRFAYYLYAVGIGMFIFFSFSG